MKRTIAGAFAGVGIASYYWPSFAGMLVADVAVTAGEGRIAAAVYFLGAAVLWFMPER
jgi:hypothetical protein